MNLKKDIEKYTFTQSSKVHVFGVPGITKCSCDDNRKFFENDFTMEKLEDMICFSDNYFNRYSLDNNLPTEFRYRGMCLKLTRYISTCILIACNTTVSFALSESGENIFEEMLRRFFEDLLTGVRAGAVLGVLIVTALRLFMEFTRGGSKYKTFDILKQCVIILIIIAVLPILPDIINTIVNTYMSYQY